MNVSRKSEIRVDAGLVARPGTALGMKRSTRYEVVCYTSNGVEKWRETFDNLVVTEGLNDALDKHFKGSGYTAAWYVGLTGGSPSFAAGDTMGSHGGWTEFEDYSEGVRQTLTLGSVSSGSVDNVGNEAEFSVDSAGTVGGAFLATDDTVGGTSDVLYGGGAFSGGDRAVVSGDTIVVTVTLTASAA